MSRKEFLLGFLAGAGVMLCATGGAAWILIHAYLSDSQAGKTDPRSDAVEAQDHGAGEELGRILAGIERRLSRIERIPPGEAGKPPRQPGRQNRCFLMKNAFSSTGELYEGLPVFGPTADKYWERLGRNPDLYPEIKRYRILWSGGAWSDWLTPGKDDFDSKTNFDGSARLLWACFTDHSFQVEFHEEMGDRCFLRRNPFVEAGETADGLPVYRPTGDEYWSRIAPDSGLHPEIKRYRFMDSGGKWSEWHTPGKNDLDDEKKPDGSRKLKWCRFSDHKFQVEFN